MNLDFPLILVMAVLVTGLVWAVDVIWLRPGRQQAAERLRAQLGAAADESQVLKVAREPVIVEYARSFFPVILIVLLLRSFLVEPFRIPSGSMMPTLLVGDFILVNKFSYGIRLPVLDTKILDLGAPERGDVIVFRYPENPSIDYIKRVVGVPGDTVAYHNKTLYVNGKQAEQQVLGVYQGSGTGASMTGASLRAEELGDVHHNILLWPTNRERGFEFTVPEGQYFVLGDNRDNSRDSRFWGTVPDENLVGKAFLVWFNWDGGVTWDRIGMVID